MRIGIDIRAIGKNRTGDETVTAQLVNNLLKVDTSNRFLLFTNESGLEGLEEIKKRLSSLSKRFKLISVLPASKTFWTFWSLPKFLKRNPIDVLHVQYITPQWLPRKVRLITTIHDVSFARFPEYISRKDLFFLRLLIPMSLKRADKIIAVSKFTKKEIIDVYGIDSKKIDVVYNGVAERFFEKASKEQRDNFVEARKLPQKFFLYVGTLQPRKDIPFLLRSFVEFKQRFAASKEVEQMNLVIGGNRKGHNYDIKIDQEFEEIRKKYPQIAKQIIFPGFISNEDLPMFYKVAQAVCMCSKYEGFGLPAIEAMASETPFISTDDSCMAEICADGASIYRHDDEAEFVEKLFQIVNNRDYRKELIEKGLKRASEFSWEKTAKQTLEVYNKFK